LTYQK